VYLRKFEEFHGSLEDIPSVLIQNFVDRGVKKFWFTGEGLSGNNIIMLFPLSLGYSPSAMTCRSQNSSHSNVGLIIKFKSFE